MARRRDKPAAGTKCETCGFAFTGARDVRHIENPAKWIKTGAKWHCTKRCKNHTKFEVPEGAQCALCKEQFAAPEESAGVDTKRRALMWTTHQRVWFCSKTHQTNYFQWIDAIEQQSAALIATGGAEKCGTCQECKKDVYANLCYETELEDKTPVFFCTPLCMSIHELESPEFMNKIYESQRAKFVKHLRDNDIDPDLLQSGDEETVAKLQGMLEAVMKEFDEENNVTSLTS